MIDRDRIGQEIKVMLCWNSYCSECVLHRYNCLNTTPEDAIDAARKNKDVFLKKFHLMNSFMGESDVRNAAFKTVVGVKMK